MLTDPLPVTYDGTTYNLPRIQSQVPERGQVVSYSRFKTADPNVDLGITKTALKDGSRRVEVTLSKSVVDVDANTVAAGLFYNSVSIAFTTNELNVGTSTDIPKIRTALLALVDSTLQGRLINGET